MIEVRQYIDELGRNWFERWFERLDAGVQARVTAYLDRLERGNFSVVKGVGSIFELRLDFGPGYRIYFGKDGETLVILLTGERRGSSRVTSHAHRPYGRSTSGARRRDRCH